MSSPVADRLNEIFKRDNDGHRHIVFWYDEKQEFIDLIDSIQLENARIHKLTDRNIFKTRYLLEKEDKTSNFLIYAPFPRPSDRENGLANIIYYSTVFYADAISYRLLQLQLPDEFRPIVKKYSLFFNCEKRTQSFQKLSIHRNPSEENICLGILSVITGSKSGSLEFSTILKNIILQQDHDYIAGMEKYQVLDFFWQTCRKKYGYTSTSPTLQKLIRTLFVTDLYQNIDEEYVPNPAAWKEYLVDDPRHRANIIQSIRETRDDAKIYTDLSADLEIQLDVTKYLNPETPVSAYLSCDTFECFDKIIIKYLCDYLHNNRIPYPKEFEKHTRGETTYFADKYHHTYKALDMASALYASLANFSPEILPNNPEKFIEEYQNHWALVDQYYRRFYEAVDQVETPGLFNEICKDVEISYLQFLETLNRNWSETLGRNISQISEINIVKQDEFFQKFVAPNLDKGATVVIISDGFRLETALELAADINQEQKDKVTVQPMLSTIPSYTALGMAALLPHRSLTINPEKEFEIRVDGAPTKTLDDRTKILTAYSENAVGLNYDDVEKLSREELRKRLTGKTLIYIYHNKIDARGENAMTEKNVFSACRDAQNDIKKIIKKITQDKSITNYIITADHGFLYTRDEILESSKITVGKREPGSAEKRFIYDIKNPEIPHTSTYSLEYLGAENSGIFVTIPRGIDIFKLQGRGLNYVHGGFSLQESLVPVMTVKTNRAKVDFEPAGLTLLSKAKIVNLIEYIEVRQENLVGETVKPFNALLYFIDEEGNNISNKESVRVDASENRQEFKIKFTFNKRSYDKTKPYFLVIYDEELDKEYKRIQFMIDIPFVPLF